MRGIPILPGRSGILGWPRLPDNDVNFGGGIGGAIALDWDWLKRGSNETHGALVVE